MITLPRKLRDPLIFLGLMITVPGFIYYISMNFGDQRVHIEKKQWNPAEAADQGFDPQHLKRAAEFIETRLPLARGMIIIKNGKTIHEKYYWKGGPQEKDYLHSLNGPVLHALLGIAIEKQMLTGATQSIGDFFPDYFSDESPPLSIADLLQVQAPLIWGDETSGYWELFYAADRTEASIKLLSSTNGKVLPAANFAANFLLAEIIQKVSAMTVFEFADQHLFASMGIITRKDIKEKRGLENTFIGFQLRTLDMAKFGYLIMSAGIWQDRQIIPRKWIQNITEKLQTDLEVISYGGWQSDHIGNTEIIMAKGEGGQFIVLAPERDILIAVSSKSLFPLSENSGYDQLFQLIFESVTEKHIPEEKAKRIAQYPNERPYYQPNFIYATNVPDDIRQFFYDFSRDIATNDINRILYHYAKGYENDEVDMGWLDKLFLKGDDYRSMYGYWKNMFAGGTGELEFVHIEKLRIENNRAYLRGTLKYSYANMNIGSIGWFPLENLIKLRGRWLWLGSPEYGAILDRDEYFDAEISADLNEFIDDCGPAFTGAAGKNEKACFSGNFLHNGLDEMQLTELLQSFWENPKTMEIHITGAEQSGEEGMLEGYMENSLIGSISLPAGMKIIKEKNRWKWAGNGIE